MCGIIATFGGKPKKEAWEGYKAQRSRGSEGFGFVALKDGRMVAHARTMSEGGIIKQLDKVPAHDAILLHHRFPTSTVNLPEAAHPLPIIKKGWQHDYYILHNGVVMGQDEAEIRKDGYVMQSRIEEIKTLRAANGKIYEQIVDTEVNDSEFLGYYVASLLEGKRKDIPMQGAIAAIVCAVNKKSQKATVYVMRNYMNPLQVHRHKEKGTHTLRIASEGKGVMLETDAIFRVNLETLTLEKHMSVAIGKTFAQSYSLYDGEYPGPGYRTVKDTVASKTAPAPLNVPTRDNSAESPIMDKELERLTKIADEAHTDLQEAQGILEGDTSPEAIAWLTELKDAADAAEDARVELAEELENQAAIKKHVDLIPFNV